MIEQVTLDNGLKIILKDMPHTHSTSIGIFTLVGLHQEDDHLNGIAHFLEHMCFKGTEKRSAKQITEYVDNLGGQINAFTSKEYTCYYIKVVSEHTRKALDLISDLYLNSTLDQADIDTEKQVVLEEIDMYEDTPDDRVHDLFTQTIWANDKLGLPIIGTKDTLDRIDQDIMRKYREHYYNPHNIIIAITGKIDSPEKLIARIKSTFKLNDNGAKTLHDFTQIPKATPKVALQYKDTEQIHFCLGTKALPFDHPDRYKLSVLSNILGGSMSSRLFQKVREKKGLAYSIYSYLSFYKNAGLMVISGGVNKKNFFKTLKIVANELHSLKEKPVSNAELTKAKTQLKGNLVLGLESASNWMIWLTKSQIYSNKINAIEEVFDHIDAVTPKDIQAITKSLFNEKCLCLAAIGPFNDKELSFNNHPTVDYFETHKIRVP